MGRQKNLVSGLLVWFLALVVACSGAQFSAVAPFSSSFLQAYLRSDEFMSAMHACFPNATNPNPAFDGLDDPSPSQCLLNDQPMAESVKAIGEGMAKADVVEELERLMQGSISTHLMMDLDYEAGIIASFVEVFFGGDQFKQGQKASTIRPHFWFSPSPIGRLSSPDVTDPNAPNIVLGSTCSEENVGGLASLKLDFTYDERVNQGRGGTRSTESTQAERRKRRKLLATRPSVTPNITDLVIDVRIAESGPTAVTGVGSEVETSQWENRVVAENLQQSDTQTYPGQPYPRTHLLLFYRDDWFRALNLFIPNTWDELISLAEALPGVAGFEGSSREARPEDFPDWNFAAFPDLEFLLLWSHKNCCKPCRKT